MPDGATHPSQYAKKSNENGPQQLRTHLAYEGLARDNLARENVARETCESSSATNPCENRGENLEKTVVKHLKNCGENIREKLREKQNAVEHN